MLIDERRIGDVTILDLREDFASSGDDGTPFRQHVRQWLDSNGQKLVLNLRNVRDLDSTGVAHLASVHIIVSNRGRRMAVCALTGKLKHIWAITGLENVFETYDDEASALASFHDSSRTGVCPVCRHYAAFVLEANRALETCTNCASQFSLSYTESQGHGSWIVETIVLPTYEREEIRVQSSWPWTISIIGRLDMFSADTLEEAWQTIPRPRRVIVEFGPQCRFVTRKGVAVLARLCAPDVDGGRTVVWLNHDELDRAMLPADVPCFHDRQAATAALRIGGLSAQCLVVDVNTS